MAFWMWKAALAATAVAQSDFENDFEESVMVRSLAANATMCGNNCFLANNVCLSGLTSACCDAAKLVTVEVMAEAGYSASTFASHGITACPVANQCITYGPLANLIPAQDTAAAQKTALCNTNDACINSVRTALNSVASGAVKTLVSTKLGPSSTTLSASNYCATCMYYSNGGLATAGQYGPKTQIFGSGNCCQAIQDVSSVAAFSMGTLASGFASGTVNSTCRTRDGNCVNENSTMSGPAPYFYGLAPTSFWGAGHSVGNASNMTIPWEAYGNLPSQATFTAGVAELCKNGMACPRMAYGEMGANFASHAGNGGVIANAIALENVCNLLYYPAAPSTPCIIANLNVGVLHYSACMAAQVLAVVALQANSTSAAVMADVGATDCWVAQGVMPDKTVAWSSGNPGCGSDGVTPTAAAVATSRTLMCGAQGSQLAALRTFVDTDTHLISVALKGYLGTNGTSTDFCLDPTTTTTTTTVVADSSAPTQVTKHTTAVALSVDLPTTLTATEKTTLKTAIETALHDSCCGPVVGSGKPFSTLTACKSTAGEGGVTSAVAMSWSGILATRQRRMLAAVPVTGNFELSSTDATKITNAKNDMVAATSGGSPTLTTAAIATAVTSGINTAVAGTSLASHNFTTTVSTLTVPTTTTVVSVGGGATSSASALATGFASLFAVVAAIAFL